MILRVAVIAVLLALFIQYVEGSVITVNKSDVHDNHVVCCIYGNCSCPSLHSALAHLTSNVVINVTTDVELSSIISLVNLVNITITGHNNPTVNCNNSGGLHFMSCYNSTIQGITWERCGSRNISDTFNEENMYPVLQLFNSCNIAIRNCSFQHSRGQAVVLLGISGDAIISHCNFLFNKEYRGHGAAVYYSSSNASKEGSLLQFMINSCNFHHNERAKSIVYFGQSSTNFSECLYLKNSKFHHNIGTPIYVSNQNLNINGNVEFYRNIAKNGGGIFISDHSNVTFHKSAAITFTNNTATNNGGAVYLINHSRILFKEHPTINFTNNTAMYDGGAVYLICYSSFLLKDYPKLYQCQNNKLSNTHDNQQLATLYITVSFYGNRAGEDGQHICAHDSSSITIANTSKVVFKGNHIYTFPITGAIYIHHYSTITFEGNSQVIFNGNGADNGGAINTDYYSNITLKESCTVTFTNNNALFSGGALYINDFSIMTIEENSNVVFNDNVVDMNSGGAMYIHDYSTVSIGGNSVVTFYNNSAFNNGGAVHINKHSIIIFEGNSSTVFNHSRVATNCGAICISFYSILESKNSSKINLSFNSAFNGGALCAYEHSNVTFQKSSMVTFYHNKAEVSGGAIHVEHMSIVGFEGNSTVEFYNNIAKINGGSMSVNHGYSTVQFEGTSTIKFYNNMAKEKGGALYIGDHCISKSQDKCIIIIILLQHG